MSLNTYLPDYTTPDQINQLFGIVPQDVPARLGISQFIGREVFYWEKDIRPILEISCRKLKDRLSVELLDTLMAAGGPVTVRLAVQSLLETTRDGWSIRLIADLRRVREMDIVELKLPPFEFISRYNEKPVIEWQCAYCGQVNLLVEHLECRKCGAPRKAMR